MSFLGRNKEQQRNAYELSRKQSATTALDLAREYLENPQVTAVLGKVGEKIIEIAYMARIPDVENGHILTLPDYGTDIFPLVALQYPETLINPMVDLAPMQQEAFQRISPTIRSGIVEYPAREPQIIELPHKEVDGGTWSRVRSPGVFSNITYETRPLVGIAQDRKRKRNMALAAIHELSHAEDALRTPLSEESPSDIWLSGELKAYLITHVADAGTARGGKLVDLAARRVATAVYDAAGPISFEDPTLFTPTDKKRASLASRNLWYINTDIV